MIRRFSTIAFILVLVLSANAQSRREISHSGHIKSMRREAAKLIDENGQIKESARVTLEEAMFDTKGERTRQLINNPDGTLQQKMEWQTKYDSQEREAEITFIDDKGKPISKVAITYDVSNRVIMRSYAGPDGPAIMNMVVSYDEKGNSKKEERRNPDGTSRGFVEHSYDSKNNLTEDLYHDGKGNTYQRNVYSYDQRGNMITLSTYDGTGASLIQEFYTYDDKDNMTAGSRYSQQNILLLGQSFKYDEFDEHGNWTKRHIAKKGTKGGTPFSENVVEYRTLTYY